MCPRPIRVVVAESNRVMRKGLCAILAWPHVEVVSEATTAQELIEQTERNAPDIVVLGYRPLHSDSIPMLEAMQVISQKRPVVVVGLQAEVGALIEAIIHGASCWLVDGFSVEDLWLAVAAASRGCSVLDRKVLAEAMLTLSGQSEHGHHEHAMAGDLYLSPRECEVLSLLAQGMGNEDVARTLSVSAGTVRTHVHNILTKLGVADRVRAVLWAIEHGLGPADAR